MKKITLWLFLLIFPYLGFAQLTPPEGFEGASFPPTTSGNWAVMDNGLTAVSGLEAVWAETTDLTRVHSGAKAAIIERENIGAGNTSRDWLITPQITVPANGQLRFWTRQTLVGNNGSTYEIRVSTNPSQTNQAAFTTIQTWTETTLNVTYSTYEEKIVPLTPTFTAGQQIYIAFVKVNTQPAIPTTGDRWLIDDVQVIQQCLDPSVLNVGAITPTSAVLTWISNGAPVNFDVEVSTAATAQSGTPTLTGTTSGQAYGGLLPGTAYHYWVRANCGGGNYSQWVGPFNFVTTPAGSICSSPIFINALPFSQTSNTNLYGDEVDTPQGGTCGATPAATNYLQGAEVFYSYTPAVSGNITISMTPTGVSSSIFVYNGCANVGVGCVAGVANNTAAIRVIEPLAVTAGTTYIIVISSSTTPAAGIPYTLIIQEFNCQAPTNLSAPTINTTSALLSWNNPSGATSWQVEVQPAGSGIPTGPGTTAGTNVNFPVGPLTAATAYQYWVRADCGGGVFSPWAGPFLFNTAICDAVDRCNYTFRMTDDFGDGWNGARMEIRQNGVVVATIGATITGAGPTDVIVPLCQNFPFELHWTVPGSFPEEVGVQVINNFAQILFTKPFDTGSAPSLLYTTPFNCNVPACLPPTGLTATAITTTTANLGWNGAGATLWDVYLVLNGGAAPTPATVPTYNDVNTNTLAVGPLAPLTTYQFYVRVVCSGTSDSIWAGPFTFTTLPTCPSPTTLVISGLSATSATLSWTNVGPATAWEVINLPCGSPVPGPTTLGWVPAPINGHTFTLNPGTCYDFYVRSVCSPTDTSPTSTVVSATTPPGCGSQFLDNGGTGNYNNSSDQIVTICPTNPGDLVTVTFTSFNTEATWDGLYVFDGNSIAAPQIASANPAGNVPGGLAGSYWGTAIPGPFTSSNANGCLTFRFRSDTSVNNPGWVATVTCAPPPTCAKPINLGVNTVTQTTANLTWAQPATPGTAASWEIVVQPAVLGDPTGSGTFVPGPTPLYAASLLTPGTVYEFYVRANCGASDGFSLWAGPFSFGTVVGNDDCINAIVVPVNDDASCLLNVNGSVVGATASVPATNPVCAGTANDDVWFKFVALGPKHYVSFSNIVAAGADLNHAIYTGASCGTMTQVSCQAGTGVSQGSVLNGLTPGNTYYIRVWTATATPGQTTTFTLCVGTVSTCESAEAFCSDPLNPFIFPNTVGVPSEGAQSCLGTNPNPTYYFMSVLTSGNMQFQISQNTAYDTAGNPTGTGLDVDFIAWGPFASNTAACGNLIPANQVGCSYSAAPVENFTIPNAIAGQVYVVVITNFNNGAGFIKFHQTNQTVPATPGVGSTDCSIVCEVDLGPDQLLCGVPSVVLDSHLVNIAATFKWYLNGILIPSATSSTYTATQSGTYRCVGTCGPNDVEDSIVINLGPSVIIGDQPSYVICDDLPFDGIATFDLSTLTPNVLLGLDTNYTYDVSYYNVEADALAGNTNTINPALPYTGPSQTIYIRVVAVGSTQCITIVPQNLVVSTSPIATIASSDADDTICSDDTATITVTPTNFVATDATYVWTLNGVVLPLETSSQIIPTASGTYEVTISLGTCSTTLSLLFTVNPVPVATIASTDPDNTICTGDTAIITVTPSNFVIGDATYVWTLNGVLMPAETTNQVTPAVTGVYEVTITLDGCSEVLSLPFTINPLPIATIDSSDADDTICSNDTATITVTPTNFVATDATYVWTLNGVVIPTATSNQITPTATGTYEVVVNLDGCTVTLSLPFTVNALPDFTLDGTNLVKCAGETAVLSVVPANFSLTNAAITYSWTLDGNPIANTTSSISVTGYGMYAVTVDNEGCTTTHQIEVTLDTTEIVINTTGECFGASYIITATPVSGSFDADTVNYEWTNDAGTVVGTNQNTFNVSEYVAANGISSFPITFTVKITTSPEGCTDTQEFVVVSSNCTIQKGISPNGDGDNESFDLRGLGVKHLGIFNRYGTKVYSQSNYTNEWHGQTDNGKDLPVGTYYFVIDQNSGETKTGWIYINK